MIEFFSPNLEHFCPLFTQIAHMCLILPRWGLILPRIPPPTPVLNSAVTNPFLGYVCTRNTPNPTRQHPFSWPGWQRMAAWRLNAVKAGPARGSAGGGMVVVVVRILFPRAREGAWVEAIAWKWAKWTTVWANWTPTGQNVWKVSKTFREVGKKKNYSLVLKIRGNQTKSVQWQFGSGRQHLSLLLSETEDRHKQAAQSLVKQLTALVR